MPRKKEFRGPSTFCEWVVGTTIPTVLGAEKRAKKRRPTKRDVIRVEVATDDESGEDTLKISYPRNRSRGKNAASDDGTKVKQVRFESAPKKSVLKKTPKVYAISDTSDGSEYVSDSSAEASSDSSTSRVILIPEDKIRVHTVKLSDDLKTGESSENNSDADLDTFPSCKCIRCMQGWQKLAKRECRTVLLKKLPCESSRGSDTETNDSDKAKKTQSKKRRKVKKEQNGSRKEGNGESGKKQGQKPEPATAETDDSESEAKEDADNDSSKSEDSDKEKSQSQDTQEDEQTNKVKGQKEKRQEHEQSGKKQQGQKKDKDKKKSDEKADEKGIKTDAPESKNKNGKNKPNSNHYPEAMPLRNPRRPNLIEPIRAEVVQTERVIESQEDPPPNAYYDHVNNVLRVYYGPVYGGHHNRGLYPKRDPNNLTLPLGTAHPTQNPYFYGFNNGATQPLQAGQGNNLGVQWPGGAWPSVPWPFAPPPGPVPAPTGAPPAANGSKGAFSDRAGRNNVVPGECEDGKTNPYYKKQQTSPFRSYNKSSPPHARHGPGSKAGSRQVSASGWNNDGAPGSVKQSSQNGEWGVQNDPAGSQTQAAGGWGGSQSQQEADVWNADATQQEASQQNSWGGTSQQDPPASSSWDNNTNGQDQQDQSWGNQQQDAEPAIPSTESNVMPGTFDAPKPWGDTTMAADTKGAVDW